MTDNNQIHKEMTDVVSSNKSNDKNSIPYKSVKMHKEITGDSYHNYIEK